MEAQPCPYCGNTRSHTQDGHTVCSNCGRQLHGTAIVAEDEADYARRGRTVKLKREKSAGKVSRVLRGAQGWRLYLKAWGHVLWKMTWTLSKGKAIGTRGELWEVVRALWEVWLERLVTKKFADVKGEDAVETEIKSEEQTTGTETDTEEETDADLADKRKWKTAKQPTDTPTLIDIASLNYIAILILRCPLTLTEFFSYLDNETVPFVRAIRHVPKDIRDRLPSEYHLALDTLSIPKPESLRDAVSRLALMFSSKLGVTVPPVNHHLILLEDIESLALPLQVYRTVQHLNTITNFDFSYPADPARRRAVTIYPEVQLMALLVVATKLQFPFSSTTKTYPKSLKDDAVQNLDWQVWLSARSAYENVLTSDQHALPSQSNPTSAITESKPSQKTYLSTKDIDVLGMSGEELDDYMAYYQRTYTAPTAERTEEGIQKRILDLFPVMSLSEPTIDEIAESHRTEQERRKRLRTERTNTVIGGLKTRRVVSDEEEQSLLEEGRLEARLLRPGDHYQIYRRASDLPEGSIERVFHQDCAKMACVDLEGLCRAVRAVEETVERWRRENRRRDLFGNQEDGKGH